MGTKYIKIPNYLYNEIKWEVHEQIFSFLKENHLSNANNLTTIINDNLDPIKLLQGCNLTHV